MLNMVKITKKRNSVTRTSTSFSTRPNSGWLTSSTRSALVNTSTSTSKIISKIFNSFANIRALQQAKASTVAAKIGITIHSDNAPITQPYKSRITTPKLAAPNSSNAAPLKLIL